VAVLRVELEIDGDVYPELHAALLSIAGEASRAERLRQLAACGLVWEKIRVHGPVVVHGGRAEGLGPASAQAAAAPSPARKTAPAAPKPRMRAPEPPPPAPSPDFVDLALDAAPPPPPAPRAPPVLMDVVDPEDLRSAALVPVRRQASLAETLDMREAREAPREAPELPPALAAAPALVLPPPAVVPPAATFLQPAPEPPDDLVEAMQAPPDPPLEHRPSTRSRLQRMKERGLFKNG
jgi:hypothetical protein